MSYLCTALCVSLDDNLCKIKTAVINLNYENYGATIGGDRFMNVHCLCRLQVGLLNFVPLLFQSRHEIVGLVVFKYSLYNYDF